ncbi:helix-turn-helix domain-containing protein [Flavilitoribacter nigricans]|uniref:HTH araC/xylS-type domain-containing protein n=1 Tax=Flavilitoribacter nigricans (strain ATCC 23147 / DSM 23189 / NBRC 102662 / NCIMB 1420 / SS-2) TaxID=1122177 RepID=A0A2D0N844_FLAN2|nr:helix-turn-helix domain-containing protein [Flavilitoribacter nigricans]PHN04568.1 hypothetical protein CRP01_21425 [Flavilitoribacter nigricans DSM 23189 = NBRC 102662]
MKNSSYQSQDDVFIQRLTHLILDKLKEEQFSVEHLAAEIGLSRSQLYRRLKRINGQTISQFIRQVRLEEAKTLLENDVGTTSEIAFQVGFNSPAYFHKCFNDYFGFTPGALKKRARGEPDDQYDNAVDLEGQPDKIPRKDEGWLKVIPGYHAHRQRLRFILLLCGLLLCMVGFTCFLTERSYSDMLTVAVLPIDFLAEEPEQAYLTQDLNEALKMELGKVASLRIISKTSTQGIAQRNLLLPEIADQLKIDAVIEGSILVIGDSLWINLQLIEALPTERQLWANEYQMELDNANPFQPAFIQEVTRQIKTELIRVDDQ